MKTITFLDTPEYEGFTMLLVCVANLTYIVVIVVSADDGVKTQTIEAIQQV